MNVKHKTIKLKNSQRRISSECRYGPRVLRPDAKKGMPNNRKN